jgi:hypothetical protein|nr:MAG TPA: hypothetical protein [Caudoviricetes sp.]
MTTKYTRDTPVKLGTLQNLGTISPETHERIEEIIDPDLLNLPLDEADNCRYPLHYYTKAVALSRLDYASVADDDVLIREATFTPVDDATLLMRVDRMGYSGKVNVADAPNQTQLIGTVLQSVGTAQREVIDVYRTPRSYRVYVALARKEES